MEDECCSHESEEHRATKRAPISPRVFRRVCLSILGTVTHVAERRRFRSWLPRNWTGHFNAIQISSFFSIKYSWILTLSNFIRSNFILFHLKYQIVQSKIARKRVDQRSRGILPPRIIGTLNFARLLFPRTRWIRLHLEMITRHVEIGFDIGRDVQQIVTLKINKHSRTSVDHRTTPYVDVARSYVRTRI